MQERSGGDTPPDISRRQGAFAFFERPANSVCRNPLITCMGWTIAGDCEPTFEVNGVPIEHIRFVKRDDVEAAYPDSDAKGFELSIDAYRYLRPPSRALHVVARGKDVLAEQFLWLQPRDSAEAAKSLLTFFIHLPKTGGTAVRVGMQAMAAAAAPPYDGILTLYDVPQLMTLTRDTLLWFDFVFGHFGYGTHQIARERPFTYLTVMRDPYEFVASLYFYQKYVSRAIEHRSIYDFIEDPESRPKITNHFTRNLCGLERESTVTSDHVPIAKRNIDEHVAFVGLVEEMPKTLAKLSALTGFDLRHTGRHNATPPNEERATLDRAAFEAAVQDRVRYDLEIYDYVRSKFF